MDYNMSSVGDFDTEDGGKEVNERFYVLADYCQNVEKDKEEIAKMAFDNSIPTNALLKRLMKNWCDKIDLGKMILSFFDDRKSIAQKHKDKHNNTLSCLGEEEEKIQEEYKEQYKPLLEMAKDQRDEIKIQDKMLATMEKDQRIVDIRTKIEATKAKIFICQYILDNTYRDKNNIYSKINTFLDKYK